MAAIPDIAPTQTGTPIRQDPAAMVVARRAEADWNSMGVPCIAVAGKRVVLIPREVRRSLSPNGHVGEQLHKAGVTPDHYVYSTCRSDARSLSTAQAAQPPASAAILNVADGFEGPVDHWGPRGVVAGWNAVGLPWMQR